MHRSLPLQNWMQVVVTGCLFCIIFLNAFVRFRSASVNHWPCFVYCFGKLCHSSVVIRRMSPVWTRSYVAQEDIPRCLRLESLALLCWYSITWNRWQWARSHHGWLLWNYLKVLKARMHVLCKGNAWGLVFCYSLNVVCFALYIPRTCFRGQKCVDSPTCLVYDRKTDGMFFFFAIAGCYCDVKDNESQQGYEARKEKNGRQSFRDMLTFLCVSLLRMSLLSFC